MFHAQKQPSDTQNHMMPDSTKAANAIEESSANSLPLNGLSALSHIIHAHTAPAPPSFFREMNVSGNLKITSFRKSR